MQIKIEKNNKKLGLKLPNKLENKQKILNKAYNYVKRIYEDLQEKFVYELEKNSPIIPFSSKGDEQVISDFELEIFK
jgi:DNA-directed RNA polymerase beta' subunit